MMRADRADWLDYLPGSIWLNKIVYRGRHAFFINSRDFAYCVVEFFVLKSFVYIALY